MAILSFSGSVIVVANIRLGLVSFESSEVGKSLSRSGPSEKEHVLAKRLNLCKLIEGQALSSCLDDSGSGTL